MTDTVAYLRTEPVQALPAPTFTRGCSPSSRA